MKAQFLADLLPNFPLYDNWKQGLCTAHTAKVMQTLHSWELAYQTQQKECGLLWVQLHPAKEWQQVVILSDKLGLSHAIDLGKIPFLVQENATDLGRHFTALFNEGKLTTIKQRLQELTTIYKNRYAQGCYDRDYGIMHNAGITSEGTLIIFDAGELTEDSSMQNPDVALRDFSRVQQRIDKWVTRHFPHYVKEIETEFEHQQRDFLHPQDDQSTSIAFDQDL